MRIRLCLIAIISLLYSEVFSQCNSDSVEITINITTDNYPSETSWQLVDQNGGGFFINPGDLTQSNTTYIYTYCVPDTDCYTFTILDTYGDGLCGSCWGGTDGNYTVSYDGVVVASMSTADFGSSEITSNIGNCSVTSNCTSNESEIVISITTDDFPTETYWQLVDQNGTGFEILAGDLTTANYTYTWTFCIDTTDCYDFTIFDTYGDGICCTWGNGSYYVTLDGNSIVNGGSFLSSETTSNIGTCISSTPCPVNEAEIVITINTDDYPTETSWFLMDQLGGGWTNIPLTTSNANSTLTWSLCVPDTNCYTFTMLDSYGDGICCQWGLGSYNVTYNGVNVANGASFAFSQEHCGIGICNPMCQISIPVNTISEGESCGANINNGCDDNFKLSNFTITGVEDPWSFGASITYVGWPVNGYVNIGPDFDPDFYIYMQENNVYYHYTDYYLNTWCPNAYGQSPAQPLSYSMFANSSITSPLELKSNSIFTTPSVFGLTYTYDFGVYDDDDGTFSLLGADDFIGSYIIPSPYLAGSYSITTSGGPDGNAYVNYTIDPPVSNYTPLANNSVIHGTYFAENNYRDTDWYEIIISDSSDLTLNSISEVPYFVYLLDGNSGCGTQNILDSAYVMQCDSFNLQQSLPPGTYWVVVMPSVYSCLPCSDSADYLLDISWVINCSMSTNANITPANCIAQNGSINLSINGGVAPYSFDWSNGSTSQNLTNELIGTYSVIVSDSNLCKDTLSNLQITDYSSPLGVSSSTTPESITNAFDGSINITINGGVAPLSYNWSGPNSFTSNIEDISGLESGLYYLEVTDINGCVVIDTIQVEEFSIDVGVSSIISPSTSCVLDSVEQVVVMISNYNVIDASDFIVSFQYNGQTFSDSVLTNIPAGDSIQFTFTNTINTNTGGSYLINAFTSHALDLDINNDHSSSSFTNYLHDFYNSDYVMGFEPNQDFSGWLIEDVNNDSYSWNVHQYTGFNSSYGAFYSYNFNGTTPADDWLISQCFKLESNVTYVLDFKYRVASAAYPEQMNVCLGSTQQGSSLNTILLQMNNIINIAYDSTTITFSVPSNGIYYIGWNVISPANMWRIDLDDINISMNIPNLYGCTDSVAMNYNPNANIDDGSCVYCVYGCMDSTAFNFDSLATCPDFSCVSIMYGCTDPTALNYYMGANVDDGSCIYNIFGCTDSLATNYDSTVLIDDGSCIYASGCTDSTAINYNPNVTISDSTCIYPILGCTDSTAINYDTLANTDDGSCLPFLYGCMDSTAINYYPSANVDDSSCIYIIYGCTDSCNSCNYNPLATMDDGSCVYSIACMATGCTDILAINYDSTACYDDSSCVYCVYGCIDSNALNYDFLATCDDGSCQYTPSACSEDAPIGLNATDILHNRATINWVNMNDTATGCVVDQYRIRYRAVGSSSWTTKTMGQPVGSCLWACNKTDKLILNLTPSTTYEYEMKAWYCGGGSSAWTGLSNFTTADDCPNVGNLTVSSGSTTQATFTWDDSNGPYSFMRIKARVDTNGAAWFNVGGTGVTYGTFTKNKNGLVPGETYRGQARTWCDPNGGAYKSPTWSSLIFWTQPTSIRIEEGISTISELSVYPNPSRDEFNVTFTSESQQSIELRIINLVGEIIFTETLENFEGEYTNSFNMSEYSKGVYLLELDTDHGIVNKKLILQ